MSLVSVCITTYNRSALIGDAIDRVFLQSFSNLEVIIVDDYSDDDTEEKCLRILEKYEGRITYIRHSKNLGLASARNSAIHASNGKYFTFIDDDDSWDIDFVKECVEIAEEFDSSWCFCGSVNYVYKNKSVLFLPSFNGKLKSYLFCGYTPPVGSQFYFLDTLLAVDGYNEEILTGVDHDLWLKLAQVNINLKSISSAISLPNTDDTMIRMTTVYDVRIKKLISSLSQWKELITQLYSEPFYHSFCNAYLIRENQRFFEKFLYQKGLFYAFKFFVSYYKQLNIKLSVKALVKYLLNTVRLLRGGGDKTTAYPVTLLIKHDFTQEYRK